MQQALAVEMERRGRWALGLPGFRFHPTEEELLDFYLRRAVHGKKFSSDVIGTLNVYCYDPSELPGLAKMGEREWCFFVPRDKRRTHGGRPSRMTERGFWKATGSDCPVRSASDPGRLTGLKKTLVFYNGRAPHGSKTNWVMNEYRLPGDAATSSSSPKDMVLCKIYRKATSLKEQERRAAMEQYAMAPQRCASSSGTVSSANQQDIYMQKPTALPLVGTESGPRETNMEKEVEVTSVTSAGSEATTAKRSPPELEMLEVPPKLGLEPLNWTHLDPFVAQLRSPWLDCCQVNLL